MLPKEKTEICTYEKRYENQKKDECYRQKYSSFLFIPDDKKSIIECVDMPM